MTPAPLHPVDLKPRAILHGVRLACVAGAIVAALVVRSSCQVASSGASAQQTVPGASSSSVVETQWNLVELNGTAVEAASAPIYIYLQEEGSKLSGSDGCNRFFGSYDLSGNSLQFHSVAQTLMACRGNFTEREAEFVAALKLVDSYRISGDSLQLRAADHVLARFQARRK